ncbi:hypothetical protein [Lysobacter gummosus]|uniref:hypothetical protein n=1 Tax=Lysobacter gummosus TaxID=262324 RepID=UPI003638B01B
MGCGRSAGTRYFQDLLRSQADPAAVSDPGSTPPMRPPSAPGPNAKAPPQRALLDSARANPQG